MGIVESYQNGAALYEQGDVSAPLAVREDGTRSTTLVWSSPLGVGEALDAFEPLIESADPSSSKELSVTAPNGYSERTDDDVEQWLDDLRTGPEVVAQLRLEFVVPDIGYLALGISRESTGMKASESTLVMTAPTLSGHGCLEKLYEDSAMPQVAKQFKDIVS